jgi:hypothetical protein
MTIQSISDPKFFCVLDAEVQTPGLVKIRHQSGNMPRRPDTRLCTRVHLDSEKDYI